jgi:hypothetical protein
LDKTLDLQVLFIFRELFIPVFASQLPHILLVNFQLCAAKNHQTYNFEIPEFYICFIGFHFGTLWNHSKPTKPLNHPGHHGPSLASHPAGLASPVPVVYLEQPASQPSMRRSVWGASAPDDHQAQSFLFHCKSDEIISSSYGFSYLKFYHILPLLYFIIIFLCYFIQCFHIWPWHLLIFDN